MNDADMPQQLNETSPIVLRQFREYDIAKLIEWIDTPDLLMRWGGTKFVFPLDESQIMRFIGGTFRTPQTIRAYTACLAATGEPVGHIELGEVNGIDNCARIGRVLIGPPEERAKGYGKAMVRALLEVGFRELKLHRVDLAVFPHNHSALAAYRSVGFTEDGTLRSARKFNGKYYDLKILSILLPEWEQQAGSS